MDSVYRAEYRRCVATLVRLLGDINLAEEAVQDAFAAAVEHWETLRPNPGAWIVTTARHRAIDTGCAVSRPARPGMPRPCCCTNKTDLRRRDR